MSVERWVIDTNVLISAALLKGSVPALLLRRVLGAHRLVFSAATFDELETRLWRPKFDRYITLEDRKLVLHDLAAVAEWVEPDAELCAAAFSRDRDDDKFVHAARAAGAAWLVSGDADLLDLKQVEGTRIVTPAGALRQLGVEG